MNARPDPQQFDSLPAFNDWIDATFVHSNGGELEILGKRIRPSQVLHALSFDTYQAAFPMFKRHREETLIATVLNSFPIIIAHPFYRFLEGSENEIQRLQFLRDSWEGLINFVHALVVSEARAARLPLSAPTKCSNILSESLAVRLATVEGILEIAANSGVMLESSKVVNLPLIATIKELNRTRNAFSHSGAVSEGQATSYISECVEDVLDILDGFLSLQHVKLIRYDQLDGMKVRHERFDGHAKTKRFGELSVTGNYLHLLRRSETLLALGGTLLSAHPFLYFLPQAGGHVTQVAFFKKTKADGTARKLVFEIVGEAREGGIYESQSPLRVQWILRRVEERLWKNKSEMVEVKSPLTVEHILPQDWIANWPLPDGKRGIRWFERLNPGEGKGEASASDRRDRLKQTFGNLTLLTHPLNSSISNGSFEVKRAAILNNSALALNRYFHDITTWNEEAIERRGEQLFEVARAVWPVGD